MFTFTLGDVIFLSLLDPSSSLSDQAETDLEVGGPDSGCPGDESGVENRRGSVIPNS
jgi:hypothetical protein